MKFILVLIVLLQAFSAQAILVCPELQGSYICDEPNRTKITVYQYEDANVMHYEVFNELFAADGEEHTVYDNATESGRYKATCDYEVLKIKYTTFNKKRHITQTESSTITKLGFDKLKYNFNIVKKQPSQADKAYSGSMICKLNY